MWERVMDWWRQFRGSGSFEPSPQDREMERELADSTRRLQAIESERRGTRHLYDAMGVDVDVSQREAERRRRLSPQ